MFLRAKPTSHERGFWRSVLWEICFLSVFDSPGWKLIVSGLVVNGIFIKEQRVRVQRVVIWVPVGLHVGDFAYLLREVTLIKQSNILIHFSVRH